MKIAPEDFVAYMHKTYPDPDGYPFREAMLKAFDYLSGNYHEQENKRKEIAEQIKKKIDENMGRNIPEAPAPFECYGYAYGDQSKKELEEFLQEDKYQYGTIGVYFHGELQDLIGYDIPLFRLAPGVEFKAINTDSNEVWRAEKERRHPNIPLGKNKITVHVFGRPEPIEAIAYIWDGHISHGSFKRGYIVLESDKDSNEFAQSQMDKKESFI